MEDSPIQDSTSDNADFKSTSDTSGSASTPDRPKGPNAAAVVLGLVAMSMAALIIVMETMNVRVDWSQVGPGALVGVGALLVVLGAVGLVRRRGND